MNAIPWESCGCTWGTETNLLNREIDLEHTALQRFMPTASNRFSRRDGN